MKSDAPVPDGTSDAAIDAPPASAQLTVFGNAQPVIEWTFADTATGANAAITLFVRNDGVASADLALSLAPGDYAIDAASSTCDDLTSIAPGAYCHVRVTFAPAAAGSHDAMLTLSGASSPFPLHGVAFGPPTGLTLNASSVDFGIVYASQAAPHATLLLVNNGTTTVSVDSLVATGTGFELVTHNCPSTLTAGGACSIELGFFTSTTGAAIGTFTVTSGSQQLVVDLTGYAARMFTISTVGGGTGTVTSMPDVQCGTPCLDNALGTVVLSASPASGSVFAGWNTTCGSNTSCTIPPGGSFSISARFELQGAKAIAITVSGAAPGFVYVAGTICTASCTTYVPSGTQVDVYGYTPSTFTGWTGDCTTTMHDCNLGTVVNDRAATVTFDRDEREVATLLPANRVMGLAMTPDGDLVVADANGVSRLTLSGAVVWSTPVAGGASDLATDAAGNVYGIAANGGVFSLTSAGKARWARSFTVARNPSGPIESTIAVSPDGTVIAAHTSDGAHVVDGSGADRFVVTGLTSNGMAVAPDGTVAIGTNSATVPPLLDVRRYDKTGAALATLSALPDESWASLVYDSASYLCSQNEDSFEATVSRFAPDLTKVFATTESYNYGFRPPNGIVIDSGGDLVAVRSAWDPGHLDTGLRIEVFTSTGTSTWTHVKTPYEPPSPPQPMVSDGVTPMAVAADANHHVAIAGSYAGGGMSWIQVYAMP